MFLTSMTNAEMIMFLTDTELALSVMEDKLLKLDADGQLNELRKVRESFERSKILNISEMT